MHIFELPRDDNGAIVGRFNLRHQSSEFGESYGAIRFQNGVTTSPLEGRQLVRLMAALGDVVDAEPVEEEPPFVAYPALADDDEPGAHEADGPAQLQSLRTPTTWQELLTFSKDELRVAAADLGLTDGRLGAPKLRLFIADQLDIAVPDDER